MTTVNFMRFILHPSFESTVQQHNSAPTRIHNLRALVQELNKVHHLFAYAHTRRTCEMKINQQLREVIFHVGFIPRSYAVCTTTR